MTLRCPRCGSPHDSKDGVAVHAWKTQDEAHADVETKDDGLEIAVKEQYSKHSDPPDDGDSKSPEGEPEQDSNSDSSDPTVNDGPPEVPDVQDDGDGDLEEAPCGCEFDPSEFEHGDVVRCTDHDRAFRYVDEDQ
jgi:hypothetical protein